MMNQTEVLSSGTTSAPYHKVSLLDAKAGISFGCFSPALLLLALLGGGGIVGCVLAAALSGWQDTAAPRKQ